MPGSTFLGAGWLLRAAAALVAGSSSSSSSPSSPSLPASPSLSSPLSSPPPSLQSSPPPPSPAASPAPPLAVRAARTRSRGVYPSSPSRKGERCGGHSRPGRYGAVGSNARALMQSYTHCGCTNSRVLGSMSSSAMGRSTIWWVMLPSDASSREASPSHPSVPPQASTTNSSERSGHSRPQYRTHDPNSCRSALISGAISASRSS
mmetsp:Transcript_24176/g.81609  ORF Transcript_24176/g.81609 Transcript_24176/m.81609 type:complete len:205 (+) Transcript_24176:692-1306(+)